MISENIKLVEGSISATYLHHETTYFCSYYFNNFMLTPHDSRNEIEFQSQTHVSILRVFQQVGRGEGVK